MALQMLTANRLTDGAVLYWQGGGWAETLEAGDVFATQAEADAALAQAQGFVAGNTVVGTYLFEVHAGGSPVKEREIIRARGPSVYDLTSAQDSHPKNPSDFSTSPQGGGEMDSFDVSI